MAVNIARIQFRRDTSANWSASNPVLADGEPGYDSTLDLHKVGNGVDAWDDLPFVSQPLPVADQATIEAGVNTDPSSLTPAALYEAIKTLTRQFAHGNVYMFPVWDGNGAHPTRPADLPVGTHFATWRQPTAPLAGAPYAEDGDEWKPTDA